MSEFYAIVTKVGREKIAAHLAAGEPLHLSEMCVGDGNGAYCTPDEAARALVHETWRGSVFSVTTDADEPHLVTVEAVIGATSGGFTIREVGVCDADGTLIAHGNFPETMKLTESAGVPSEVVIRMSFVVASSDAAQILVRDSALASRDWVEARIRDANTTHTGQITARLASTAPLALEGTPSIDGVQSYVGDVVLVKDQGDAVENGLYTVQNGLWTRAQPMREYALVSAATLIQVAEGDTWRDTLWVLATDGAQLRVGVAGLRFAWAGGLAGITQPEHDCSRKLATTEFVERAGSRFALAEHKHYEYAPIISPQFLAEPRAPTPALGDVSTLLATTEFVYGVANLLAPRDHQHIGYAPIESPAFTGEPTVPTPAPDDDSERAVNARWVRAQLLGKGDFAAAKHSHAEYAPLDSPRFIGEPRAPTPQAGDRSDRIATTDFVRNVLNEFGAGAGGGDIEFPGTLNHDGYVKLPNGLIIQWGKFNICAWGSSSDGGRSWTAEKSYPITFPGTAFAVIAQAGPVVINNANEVSSTQDNCQQTVSVYPVHTPNSSRTSAFRVRVFFSNNLSSERIVQWVAFGN